MPVSETDILGVWIFSPKQFSDTRGTFFEWYQNSTFEEQTGYKLELAQANCSISNRGVVRGIHYADIPPGQAKYVTCFTGSVFDVFVDLRQGSPTFGKWSSAILDSRENRAVFIPSGIGHAFMALEDNTTFVYLCDQRYNPDNEHDINPLDPTLAIDWPMGIEPLLSPKDAAAPSFLEILPYLPKL